MNNKERDEKFLKSWLKKKISITTSTVVSFLITGAIGSVAAYGANAGNRTGQGTNDSVAIGTQSNSTAGGVAVGKKAQATGNEGAVAVGVESTTREYGVAIGYKAGQENWTPGSASHSNITIGANTKVGDKGSTNSVGQSIAIGSSQGNGAWAKGTQAIAIGSDTIAEGDSSVVIGGDDVDRAISKTKSYVKKSYDKNDTETSTAVNNQSLDDIYKDLTGNTSGLGGYRGTTAGEASVALGVKAAAGDLATALGTMSEAKGINSLALGTGALATQANAVAVGAGSSTEGLKAKRVTDANIGLADGTNVNFGNFAGASNVTEGDMVSFGTVGRERQLKNIAPGELSATSTDAATGSQLFSVAKKLSEDINSKFRYVSIKSNDAGNKLNDGATENNAIAIGPNASTKVASAISLGDGANVVAAPTTDKNGKLLQTVMSSGSGVAIGKNASAVQAGVAIGDTSSTVTSGIAIGREAKVTNKYEAASGPYAKGDSQDGYLNYDRVQNPDNLQYSKIETTGNDIFSPDRYNGQGIAIGYKAESNMFGTSLGNSAVAKQGGLALGTFAKAEGATATAIGLGANSSGARGISMGRQASATTADSVAIGTGARGGASSAGGSVAVGGGAAATGTQAIAIGGLYGNDLYSSTATKDGAGNLTKNTQASGEASIAMGVNTKATGTKALAMGAEAQAKSEASVAVGVNAVSDKGIAIGKNSISRQDGSISLGLGASNNGGVAIGEAANAIVQSTDLTTANGLAFGKGSVAKGSVSIGDESYSDHLGVSIGYKAGNGNSNTGRSYNNITIGSYTKAGEAGKIVSQGIAIGSGTKEKEGAWAKGDQSIAIGSNTVAKGDSSIVIGGDDLDAVSLSRTSYTKKIFDKNGTQTSTQNVNNQSLNDIYKNLTGRTEGLGYKVYNGTNSGQGAVALGVKAEAGDIALAIGTLAEAKGINSVAIGTGAQTPQANAVAIGGGSSTAGLQGRQITDANVTLTDGSTMNLTNFAGATNVEEGSMVSFGRAGRERQLKNIAPGEISATSTDAINGSQLYSVAKTLGEGWKADAGGNKIGASTLTSVKPGNTVVYSAGSNLQVKQTVDATNGKQTYEYSLNKDLTGLDSVTTKKLTVPGTGGKDTVIDNNGINAGNNKITNVAPGVNGTDAVNKNQLDQKIGDNTIKLGGDKGTTGTQNLSKAGGLQFNIKSGDGLETSASGTDVTIELDTVTKQKLNKAVMPLKFSGDDYDPFDEVSTVVSKELGQKLEIVGGADTTDPTKLSNNNIGTMVDGTGKINIKLAKELKDLTSAEFKTAAGDKTVINGNGLTVTPSTAGAAPISVTKDGISAGDKKVTNVAPGAINKTSTDAINGSQLYNLASNTIQLGGDKGTTGTQQLDNAGGIKFDIVGANGITTEAKNGKVTVSVDPSKLSAGSSKLSYTANGDTTKQEVKLSDGLNFTDGNLTTASVAANGVVKYDVKTSALTSTPDGKVTVPTTDGVATAKDVANAINNSGWKANADATGTGIKTGTPSAKLVKNGSTVSYVAGDNLTVAQDVTAGDHKYTYSLNKVLKDLTSAEFKTAAGDKTVINGDGLTVSPATPGTAPISITKDGISAGDKKVTNVAPGTISKTSTDAINGSQLYNLASNTIQLGGDKATTTDKQTLDKTGGIKFDIVGANGITTEAKDGKVTVKVDSSTIGANAKLSYTANGAAPKQEVTLANGLDFKNGNFTTATVGANGEVKYDTVTQGLSVSPDGKAGLPNPATPGATTPNGLVTAQDVADALNNVGWKATADATGTGVKTGTPSAQLVKNGSTVSYVAGDNLTVAQAVDANGNHKYTYSLNKQLKDLTSAEFVNPTSGNKTVVNGDGLTITPSTPGAKNISITKDGISAGDKKITDVADGDITPTSKDAINGSQLYKLASNTISLGGDNSTVTATQQLNKNGGIKFNIVGDNGIITEAKDDKVIVRVNPATIGSNITLKYAANGANGQTVKLSDGLNFQDGNFTKASVDTAGKVKYDTVTQAIAPTADGTAQVAPGSTPGLATSADVVNAINNSGWKATAGGNVTGTATPTVVKNGQEVEFNAGDNLKVKQTIDPTTGKQTYEYSLNKDLTGLNSAEFTNAAGDKTKITAGGTEYTNAAGDKTVVNSGGITISSSTPGAKDISVTKDGISAGDKVIKNVAAGVNDTDAVNVSQLKDVDNKITNVNTTINKGLNFKGNTGATVNKQLGDTLEIVGEGTKADSEYSGENIKVVEDNGRLVVKMSKEMNTNTVTANTVNTNSVAVGLPGKDGVITVKDANGKDGVSINGKDGSIGLNGKDGSSATISTVQGNPGVAGTPGTTMDRIQYTDKAGTPHQVATLDDGMKYGGDTGAVINKKLNQQVNVVGGITDTNKLSTKDNIGVVSDGANNLKVRLAKDLDGLESVKVRDTAGNSTVVKGDGVTITSSSGDTVSLTDKGLDNGGNVITNVAAGKDGTDAVNVDQLNQAVGNIVNAAGDAIVHVNNKVDKLGDRVNKGLAGAAAMAGLEFMDIGINQATVAAAVGGYRGTHAVAVGVQAAPTENTRVNAKVSMTPGSRSETMYSVGASYRFNWR